MYSRFYQVLMMVLLLLPAEHSRAGGPAGLEAGEAEGLEIVGPEQIMHVTRHTGVTPLPAWIAAEAVMSGSKMNTQLFSVSSLDALEYWLGLPEDPEDGCIPVGLYYDFYGALRSPETAKLIVRVRIIHSEPGIGFGAPGTLFRGKPVEEIRGPQAQRGRSIVDFFMPVGRVPVGDRVLCPQDNRFPELEVGDEAILFVYEFYSLQETLVSIGDGSVLGIRQGRVVEEGDFFKQILDSPENLDTALRTIQMRAGVQ